MKHNFFGFMKKQPTVIGITEDELNSLREKLRVEYVRESELHKKPTEYMRGIMFAIDALDAIETHEL